MKSSYLKLTEPLAMNGRSSKNQLGEPMRPGERARWSIVQEASALKAGNVHPSARFDNMAYSHFLVASESLGTAIDRTIDQPLGPMVMECTRAMLDTAGVNTSLGTILLLAPLIQCERLNGSDSGRGIRDAMLRSDWSGDAIQRYLQGTTAEDCDWIYRAIAACKPGGIGVRPSMDILGPAPDSILAAMFQAADRDDVALQYCNGYVEVARYARTIVSPEYRFLPLGDAIRRLQLLILSERVDSLIVRKCGMAEGRMVQSQAQQLMGGAPFGSDRFEANWAVFDAHLRRDGNRLNPGTTADLIAAALYCASSAWG